MEEERDTPQRRCAQAAMVCSPRCCLKLPVGCREMPVFARRALLRVVCALSRHVAPPCRRRLLSSSPPSLDVCRACYSQGML